MEKARDWEQKTIINELTQGRELAKQLRNHLNPASPSQETRESLVEKILSSYDKALSMLKWGGFVGEPRNTAGVLESLCSLPGSSPRSEGSDRDCKDQDHRKDVLKKRKTLPQWTEQVRVFSGTAMEGPLDDGYSWRKYGQKDILGANFPRAYYRCSHRHVQGCLATKQVQRSDEDPSIFELSYRGRHTCIQASHLTPVSATLEQEGPKQNKDPYQPEQEEKQKQPQEILLNFGSGLKVKTEDLDTWEKIFPSFSFPSTSIGSENAENYIFSESMTENNFMDSFSPAFISPATSESNYFSVSPCQVNSFGMGHNLQTSESDLTETISAPTSVTNSPMQSFDFSLDQVDFDSNFSIENLDFFP